MADLDVRLPRRMIHLRPVSLLLIFRMSLGLVALLVSIFAAMFFIRYSFAPLGFWHHLILGWLGLLFAYLAWQLWRKLCLLWRRLFFHRALPSWVISSSRRPPGGDSGPTCGE